MKNIFMKILKDAWFHIVFILSLIVFMSFWPSCIDKTVGLISLSVVLLVLIIGKYRYFKNVRK